MAELYPLAFEHLIRRAFYERRRQASIFDLPASKFYHGDASLDTSVDFHSQRAATPVGPAAGPQSQLAQNIVLSWLGGSRIIELKTIQINDQLKIPRPCIDAANIGYNVEWSQELRLEVSLKEYVAAHMLIEIIREANLLGVEGPSFKSETIFDISVGYDLAGIRSEPVRRWLEAMQDARLLVEQLRREIPSEFSKYRHLDFKTNIAGSVTLSTFHGCPADEIERIVEFLLAEMGFHVTIKMNPPMLGRERLEYLLYDRLGYHDIEVNQKIYDVNITFDDAVDVCRRLQSVASKHNKRLGVKFSNTLEVINKGTFFTEEIMYMSGAPLYVLALSLAQEWRRVMGPEFPISFSAGIDAHNFADAVAINLVPVTTCTDLLRPGGYGRLYKYLLNLEKRMKSLGVQNIGDYIIKSGGNGEEAIHQACQEIIARIEERHSDAPKESFEEARNCLRRTEQALKENLASSNVDLKSTLARQKEFLSAAVHSARISKIVEEIGDLCRRLTQLAGALNTPQIVEQAIENPRYHAQSNRGAPRKIGSHLLLYDCINCDKCIPVCPNDANFSYEIEPMEIAYTNYRITQSGIEQIPGGVFRITKSRQIANYADFCNECGNCDIFCPEDGGPYIEKPRLFGSLQTWQHHSNLDGFCITGQGAIETIHGRIKGDQYLLRADTAAGRAVFEDNGFEVELSWPDCALLRIGAKSSAPVGHILNMQCCYILATLLRGILEAKTINYINLMRNP